MRSYLPQKFTVESVPYNLTGNIKVNIKRRRSTLRYSTLTTQDGRVNIAHIVSTKTNTTDNLSIIDRSRTLPENNVFSEVSEPIKITSPTFTTFSEKFVITDVFTTDTATQEETPLFYYHKLLGFNSDLDEFANLTLKNVEFTDYLKNKISNTQYYIDSSLGKVFHNLSNKYDVSIQELDEIFFIKYSVGRLSGQTNILEHYWELINSEPAFHEASFDDVDAWGNLIANSDAYLITPSPTFSSYTVKLPSGTTKAAYKEIEPTRLTLKKPTAGDLDEPWYIRVSNGKFVHSGRQYRLAEFNDQYFNPYPPYKYIENEPATWLYKNIIKVDRNIVNDTSGGFYIDILVYEDEGKSELLYSWTTNETKIGTTWTAGIDSVDETGGFIELTTNIKDTNYCLVSYYTELDEYEVRTIDFNPANNLNLPTRTVFYISPETSYTGTLANTLFYLNVNQEGKITYCSQATQSSTDYATQKLINEDFYSDGTPKHNFYYDITSSLSGLYSRVSGVYATYKDELSFLDKYTVETVLGAYTTISGQALSGAALLNYNENTNFLVLGEVSVGESHKPELVKTIYDMRVLGGGLKPEYKSSARDLQPESMWYWDSINQYPGQGSYYVEVPSSLDFTTDELKSIATRHTICGFYPVIRTYGNVDPVIISGQVYYEALSGVALSGMIWIEWPSYGAGVEYNTWLSTTYDGTYTQCNPWTLVDDGTSNTFMFSGLNFNQSYYLYVDATKDDETTISKIVSFTTTRPTS